MASQPMLTSPDAGSATNAGSATDAGSPAAEDGVARWRSLAAGNNSPQKMDKSLLRGNLPDMMKMMMKAATKFQKLDLDDSGKLEGAELEALTHWVFKSFHPGGQALTAQQVKKQSGKLLKRLDKDHSGSMSFDEFEAWFQRTCRSIQCFKRAQVFSPHCLSPPFFALSDLVQGVNDILPKGQRTDALKLFSIGSDSDSDSNESPMSPTSRNLAVRHKEFRSTAFLHSWPGERRCAVPASCCSAAQ